ncbi:MAG: hypothetical protein ACK417_04060 [Bacteroidia bacterium]
MANIRLNNLGAANGLKKASQILRLGTKANYSEELSIREGGGEAIDRAL